MITMNKNKKNVNPRMKSGIIALTACILLFAGCSGKSGSGEDGGAEDSTTTDGADSTADPGTDTSDTDPGEDPATDVPTDAEDAGDGVADVAEAGHAGQLPPAF